MGKMVRKSLSEVRAFPGRTHWGLLLSVRARESLRRHPNVEELTDLELRQLRPARSRERRLEEQK